MLTLLFARYELQRSLQLSLFHLAARREIAAEQDGRDPDAERDADLAPVADAHEPHHQAANRLVEPSHGTTSIRARLNIKFPARPSPLQSLVLIAPFSLRRVIAPG